MPEHVLSPYRSPEALVAEVERLGARLDAERVEIGCSHEGAPIIALRVPSPAPSAPRVLCCANIHGPELVGTEVALGLLEALHGEGPAQPLRARAEVWVVPSLNPDGHARTFAKGGDAPLATLRVNAQGVDLNRNYPLPPGGRRRALPGAGSDRPGDATYRGPSPLSEPETRAVDDLCAAWSFAAGANLHSFMGTVIPARVTDRGCFAAYRGLARAFAGGQPRIRYRRLSSRLFDVFTGEQEDHQHHGHDLWAACIETFPILASYRQHLRAPTTFWRFNPHAPAPWVDNDVPGLVAYFLAALDLPRPSAVRSADRPARADATSRTDL